MAQRLVSVWASRVFLGRDKEAAIAAATELEEVGYDRIWFSAGFDPGVPARFGELLDATKSIGVAPGILSIYAATPQDAATATLELEKSYPGRFLLGLGVSHAVIVEGGGGDYSRPYSRMVEYLDALDAAGVPPERRALAALGPKMLRLAAERSAGAHPYFVTAEHTAFARETMGPDTLLAPEVAVVVDPDPESARTLARAYTTGYLTLPNYVNNLRRFGWTDEDFADGGSDRLVDALIPHGDAEAVAAGIEEHYRAGADEVTIQVLAPEDVRFPADSYRRLAAALIH